MLCGEFCDSYLEHCWSKQVEHISRAINAKANTIDTIIASSFIELDQ